MMLKAILLSLTLLQVSYSDPLDTLYRIGTFPKGTPYIRLKVPENKTLWTCFNEKSYKEFIYLKTDSPLKDSLALYLESELDACNKSNSLRQEQVKIKTETEVELKQFADEVFIKYEKAEAKLSEETWKKYKWAGTGFVVGLLSGILTTLALAK